MTFHPDTGTAQDKYLVRNYGLESFAAVRRDCKAVLQKKLGLVVTPNAVSWQHIVLFAFPSIPISSIFFILLSIVASRRSFTGTIRRMCLVLKLRNVSNHLPRLHFLPFNSNVPLLFVVRLICIRLSISRVHHLHVFDRFNVHLMTLNDFTLL